MEASDDGTMGREAMAKLIGVAGLRGLPDVMGGVESHCEAVYPRMIASDPSLEVVCAARRPYVKSAAPYKVHGLTVLPLPSTRKASVEAPLNTLCAIGYFGLRRRPAILHIHAIGPALLTPVAKLLGLKVVVTHHGRDYNRAKWGRLAKAILRMGERMALRHADRVIAVSESLAQELQREFPDRAERVRYIPNGVPASSSPAPDVAAKLGRFGLRPDGYILSVGRLVPEKGFDDLIDAHARSATRLPLVIVGGADHETDYVRALKARACDRVIFTGLMPRDEVLDFCRNAACFVLASHHEGLPIAALEAASVGAPLLLSDISANRDLKLPVEHYFPVGDVDALARRLDQGFEGLGDANGDVVARFDWDRIAQQTAALYAEMMAR